MVLSKRAFQRAAQSSEDLHLHDGYRQTGSDRMMIGTVGIALMHFDAVAEKGYLNLDRGARVRIDSSDDRGWLYGYDIDGAWGWFPKYCVGLPEPVTDNVWLTSLKGCGESSQAAGGQALIIGGCEDWEAYEITERFLRTGIGVDLLGYTREPTDCQSRASIFDVAAALLSSRNYKTCVIPPRNYPASSEFLGALSTWVCNGGVLIMASQRQHDSDFFRTDDVVREWFGKAWITGNSYNSIYMNPARAHYNPKWFHSDAYTELDGNVETILKCDEFLCMSGALYGVTLGERVFHHYPIWDEWICAVASGRVSRGRVCVYAGSECFHVLATIARIPPAVFWSDIRPFILALSHSGEARRAIPASTDGLAYNFCSLKVPLAIHILIFLFGPVHVPLTCLV